MLRFSDVANGLEESDLNQTLSTYALLAKAGLASKTICAEVEKYPESAQIITLLDAGNILSLEHRQLVIDLFFACKMISTHPDKNPQLQFALLTETLQRLQNNQLLTTDNVSKAFASPSDGVALPYNPA